MTDESRYHLLESAPGGLLLDLRSGALINLNDSATAVWKQHLAGVPREAIAKALVHRYQIAEERARRDVDAALDVAGGPPPPVPTTEFRYGQAPEGYALFRMGEPVIRVEESGRSLSWCHASPPTVGYARSLLQSIAPKIMSRRGHLVLHSSAALVGGSVIAFSGHGGAGKTTTARALADSGGSLVSEDKLLVRVRSERVDVVLDAETAIQSWARVAALEIVAGRPASCEALNLPATDSVAPLREIGFIAAERRRGADMVAEPLTRLQATWAIFYNAFHGSAVADDWKQQLETCAAIAEHVAAFQLTTPEGLSSLTEAARELARRGTLRS